MRRRLSQAFAVTVLMGLLLLAILLVPDNPIPAS